MTTTAVSTAHLPSPSGTHAVGRSSLELVDPDRPEIYSSDPTDHRELVLWTWYPADPDTGSSPVDYLPGAWAAIGQGLGLEVDGVHGHAFGDVAVASGSDRLPVLLLSPSGFSPLLMTAIGEELASHGYVVVGVNHTYESPVTVFADGRIVPMDPAAVAGVLGPQVGPHEQ